MDDKTKLYVFEKKEVFLIFIFMLLISVISFLLGLKLGQEHRDVQVGITKEDRAKVEKLLSRTEESVEKVVEEKKDDPPKAKKDLNQEVQNALKKEFEKEFSKENKEFNEAVKPVATPDITSEQSQSNSKDDGLTGKYTVQLGAYRSIKDAEEFAAGFKVRGYQPIINEVDIPNKGIYFRVSIGIYDTLAEAKAFIVKERALIQGYDYIIVQFD